LVELRFGGLRGYRVWSGSGTTEADRLGAGKGHGLCSTLRWRIGGMRLSSSPMPTTWIRDRSGSRRLELFSAFHTNLPFPKANPKHVSDRMRWQIFSSTALPKLPSNGEVSSSKSAQSTVNRWNAVLQDEERYQSQNYPTSEDLPGCMSLMCALSPSLHPRQLIIAQGRLPHVLWSVPRPTRSFPLMVAQLSCRNYAISTDTVNPEIAGGNGTTSNSVSR